MVGKTLEVTMNRLSLTLVDEDFAVSAVPHGELSWAH